MSRYRKIDTRTFADAKFRELSKPQPCGQYLWLWLLSGPATCAIPGVLYGRGRRGMAELLDWPDGAFAKAFQEVLDKGMVEAAADGVPLFFIPNAIKYNAPQSPNVILSWAATWNEIPECILKNKIREVFKAFVKGLDKDSGKAFQKAFEKACPKTMANQEQEQEQEAGTEENQKLSFNEGMKRKGFSNTSEIENLPPQRREVLSSDGNEPTSSRNVLDSRTQLSPNERWRAAMKRVEEKERKAHTLEIEPATGSTWSELQSRKGIQTSAH